MVMHKRPNYCNANRGNDVDNPTGHASSSHTDQDENSAAVSRVVVKRAVHHDGFETIHTETPDGSCTVTITK
jgi:hypothetical protein